MLDMIVSSLDSESAELEKGGDEAPERNSHQTGGQAGQAEPDFGPGLGAGFGSGALTRLSGAGGEYMASAMVPMIPGFLDVMREDLRTLEDGVAGMKFAQVQEVTARMQSRSRTYGLSNLERMAACVERAAQAKDREAVNDLAEELALMCRRYLNSLRKTHDNASK
jgi:HPt (histidine-containing phosphotransfer) domain-containing protein